MTWTSLPSSAELTSLRAHTRFVSAGKPGARDPPSFLTESRRDLAIPDIISRLAFVSPGGWGGFPGFCFTPNAKYSARHIMQLLATCSEF